MRQQQSNKIKYKHLVTHSPAPAKAAQRACQCIINGISNFVMCSNVCLVYDILHRFLIECDMRELFVAHRMGRIYRKCLYARPFDDFNASKSVAEVNAYSKVTFASNLKRRNTLGFFVIDVQTEKNQSLP